MRYYKVIDGNYIISIGTGDGGSEINKSEYDQIMDIIKDKPARTETKDYRLTVNLTWEEYEHEPDPDPELSAEDALNILLGGE